MMGAVHREQLIQGFPSRDSETGAVSAGRLAADARANRLVINHQSVTLDRLEETTLGIHEIKAAYEGPV